MNKTIARWIIIGAAAILVGPQVLAQPPFSPGLPETDTNPPPTKSMCWNGSAYVLCGTGGASLPTSDPNNASYSHFSESSSAASYTFNPTNVAKARGWYSNCPTGTTETVTLTDATGGTKQITLYDGPYGAVPDVIASFSGNTALCTIQLEY